MNDFLETTGQAAAEAAQKAKETAAAAADKCEELCESTTAQVESLVKKHPVWSVMASVGVGFAVGVLARHLLTPPPPPPKNRALQALGDIQTRLASVAGPVYDRASHYAEEGMNAVKDGMTSLGNTRFVNRIKGMFS